MHWLCSGFTKINYRKPAMAEKYCFIFVLPQSFSIRPPVGQCTRHFFQMRNTVFVRNLNDASDTTHIVNIENNRESVGIVIMETVLFTLQQLLRLKITAIVEKSLQEKRG